MNDFVAFALSRGVLINPAKLYASEKIKRCPTEAHPKSTNGAYFFDGDRGWVYSWDGDNQVHWSNSERKPWTEAEKQAWKQKRQDARRAEQIKHAQAAHTAQQMLRDATLERHDYLHRKGFRDMDGHVMNGELLIPMRDLASNALRCVQRIWWDGEERKFQKKMLHGMSAKLAVLRLGPQKPQETIFVEGYATGLSVALAAHQMGLRASVLVCFSDRNLVAVASHVSGRKYCYADHDKSGAGERAAIDAGLPYCMSDTLGNDANDDHVRHGLMAVRLKLMEARLMK